MKKLKDIKNTTDMFDFVLNSIKMLYEAFNTFIKLTDENFQTIKNIQEEQQRHNETVQEILETNRKLFELLKNDIKQLQANQIDKIINGD